MRGAAGDFEVPEVEGPQQPSQQGWIAGETAGRFWAPTTGLESNFKHCGISGGSGSFRVTLTSRSTSILMVFDPRSKD